MKVIGYVIEKTPTSGPHIGEPVKILKGGKEVSMESGYFPEELFNNPQGAQMVATKLSKQDNSQYEVLAVYDDELTPEAGYSRLLEAIRGK